jgi:hypothetical protein
MGNINSYFTDFLTGIRLTQTQKDDAKRGHKTLRSRLVADDNLKDIIVTTFLQGSYRRSTAVRPNGEKRADVDVIVVTTLDQNNTTPEEALEKFEPFAEKYYKGKWTKQGRSIGITLSYVDLDIVVTSAPSEIDKSGLRSNSVTTDLTLEDLMTPSYDWRLSKGWNEPDLMKAVNYLSDSVRAEAEWKLQPLWIPDRDADIWEQTHPLEQIRWTRDKNKTTNAYYVNIVKAFKWWRTLRITDLKYPKGYPIEHMIGDCCPNGVTSMAEGIVLTFENFVDKFSAYRSAGIVPEFPDRGVSSHDVWHRITSDDFKTFYDHMKNYSEKAREAYDEKSLRKATEKWQEIFGQKFPLAPEDDDEGGTKNSGPTGFTPRSVVTDPDSSRFA